MTVSELRKALEGVPDAMDVCVEHRGRPSRTDSYDTGVQQIFGAPDGFYWSQSQQAEQSMTSCLPLGRVMDVFVIQRG